MWKPNNHLRFHIYCQMLEKRLHSTNVILVAVDNVVDTPASVWFQLVSLATYSNWLPLTMIGSEGPRQTGTVRFKERLPRASGQKAYNPIASDSYSETVRGMSPMTKLK